MRIQVANAYLVNPIVEELLEERNVADNSLQVEQKVESLLVRNIAERLHDIHYI